MVYKTEARNRIIDFLKSDSSAAFTAEEIFFAVSEYGIGRSTVFRQLSKLSSSGEIKRMSDELCRSVKYQYLDTHACHEHLHLKCKSCGKLIHLDGELSRLFEEKILSTEHFSVDTGTFLPGICEGCKYMEDEK